MNENKVISTSQFPEISYTVYGDGPPVILLHGFPLNRTIWEDVASDLADRFKVITPDLPGAGDSPFLTERLSVEDMAEFVHAIIAHEGLEKVIIAGHSMGGYVAIAYADKYPGNLAGLGMIHSTARADSKEKKEQRMKAIELFRKGGEKHFIHQMVPPLFGNGKGYDTEINRLISTSLLTSSKSLISFYNAMMDRRERSSILHKLTMPVLWVLGEDDKVLPIKDLTQQTSLANVNYVYVYSDCGHMSMIEAPLNLKNDLADFAVYCYSR